MPDEPTLDERPIERSIERSIKDYIANGAAEGATLAAQRLSQAIGVGLDEVLTAVQAATVNTEVSIVGQGSVTATALVVSGSGLVQVSDADAGGATETLEVVRSEDVEDVVTRTSRDGPAKLSDKDRVLIAVTLIAAIYSLLPPHFQAAILQETTFLAAVAAVVSLLLSR